MAFRVRIGHAFILAFAILSTGLFDSVQIAPSGTALGTSMLLAAPLPILNIGHKCRHYFEIPFNADAAFGQLSTAESERNLCIT